MWYDTVGSIMNVKKERVGGGGGWTNNKTNFFFGSIFLCVHIFTKDDNILHNH